MSRSILSRLIGPIRPGFPYYKGSCSQSSQFLSSSSDELALKTINEAAILLSLELYLAGSRCVFLPSSLYSLTQGSDFGRQTFCYFVAGLEISETRPRDFLEHDFGSDVEHERLLIFGPSDPDMPV